MQHPVEDLPGTVCTVYTSVLSIFYEKSATPAMIKHGMDVIRQAIQYISLSAVAKFVQWKWPDGERVQVVMQGGLHSEMAVWHTLGDILEGFWLDYITHRGKSIIIR